MSENPLLERIRDEFGDSLISAHQLDQDTVVISRGAILELARFLKEQLGFEVLMDLTAVDYFKRRPRFEVVYHFLAMRGRKRLRVKVPVGGMEPKVDSLTPLWPNANWFEREVFDMFGIRFEGHPDLRRLLLYPEFEGHPLRKDYPVDKRQPLIGPQD